MIERVGSGPDQRAAQPEDAGALSEAVREMASDPSLYGRMSEGGPAYVSEHFDRRKLARRYLLLLRSVAGVAS
mgnify:CR=1 FL=1